MFGFLLYVVFSTVIVIVTAVIIAYRRSEQLVTKTKINWIKDYK